MKSEKFPDKSRTITLLKGWAEANPKEITTWYLSQPVAIQNKYRNQFLVGLSRKDPKKALELMFQPDKPYDKNGSVLAIINNAVDFFGVDGVEESFTSMRARTDLKADAKGEFFAVLANKRLSLLKKTGDPASQILNWFQTHAGQDYVRPEVSTQLLAEAAQANAPATFSCLELQSGRLAPDQTAGALYVAASELQRQSPQQLTEWLASHQTHPHRDQVIAGATNALVQAADFSGALQMANSIGNAKLRAEAIENLQRQSQRKPSGH